MQIKLFNEIINRFYAKNKYRFYFLVILSLIAGFFEYVGLVFVFQFVLFLSNPNSEYLSKIIKFFSENFNISNASKISLILGFLIILIYILKNVYMLFFTKFNNSILEDLSVKIITKILKNLILQDYLTINSIPKDEKLNIISKTNLVVLQYLQKYINLVVNIVVAAIIISYLFVKFAIVAIIATVFIAILSMFEYLYLKKQSNYQNLNYSKVHDLMHSILLKAINSYKEIKLNNMQGYFIEQFSASAKKYASLNNDRNFNNVFHIYFTEISVMFIFALVIASLYLTSNFDNSLILTSICTICVIILRLTPLINRAQSCLYCINSNEKIVKELFKFDDNFKDKINCKITDKKMKFEKIIFQNVCFSFDNGNGLKNVNLEINKGDFIGIAGQSGSYKTTLTMILSGFIKPDSGRIIIDGNILVDDNMPEWQNNVAFLSQDFNMIFDNIFENIAMSEIYDKDKVKKFIDKFDISLNIDENKKICELSHGQRQRIALLSTLYQNKDLIILDEPTSSIDVISEEKINKILGSLKGKKTIISIAHRLNTLKNCTKIIFINKNGKIDIDTFENLKNNSEFRQSLEISNFAN